MWGRESEIHRDSQGRWLLLCVNSQALIRRRGLGVGGGGREGGVVVVLCGVRPSWLQGIG